MGRKPLNILERRLKLLELEGLGFSQSEIVQQLANRYDCTLRTIQYDFKNRGKWQPIIDELEPKTSLLKVLNRNRQIYRKASFMYLQANNEAIKLGALRLMRDSNMDLLTVTNPRLKEQPPEPLHEKEEKHYDYDSLTKKEKAVMVEASRLLRRIERKGPKPYVHIH